MKHRHVFTIVVDAKASMSNELMTVWPSGLRRWLKAPFRKGVGSNPTAVKLTYIGFCARIPSYHDKYISEFMLAVDVLNCFRDVLRCDQQTHYIRGSIVVSISACHAEDPGSIPGRGVLRF